MSLRLEKLRAFMRQEQIEACLVNKPENQQYFSGFTGQEALLVITATEALLMTDFRYIEQAQQETTGFQIVRTSFDLVQELKVQLTRLAVGTVGFEQDFLTYQQYQRWEAGLKPVKLVGKQLDPLRMVKDEQELERIAQAVRIAEQGFQELLPLIKPGVTENDLAIELDYRMRKHGAERMAFDLIVVSGVRSSLPHGRPSDKTIANGEFVTFDFGAVYQGYCSDITRTVMIGRPSKRQQDIYDIVYHAQLAGLDAVRPGAICKDVDAVSRNMIADAGFGDYFGHGLGHGVGLFIHENPRFNRTDSTVLKAGMVMTVEPGIYLPDCGGVRIEDTVVVTPNGREILTTGITKKLIVIE